MILKLEIVYPDVATGLSFYTEFALTTPQTFDADNSGTIDIPLVGSAIGKCQSGLITFGKTNWPDNTGYTIQANIDTILNSMGKKNRLRGKKRLMTNSAVQFKKIKITEVML